MKHTDMFLLFQLCAVAMIQEVLGAHTDRDPPMGASPRGLKMYYSLARHNLPTASLSYLQPRLVRRPSQCQITAVVGCSRMFSPESARSPGASEGMRHPLRGTVRGYFPADNTSISTSVFLRHNRCGILRVRQIVQQPTGACIYPQLAQLWRRRLHMA